MTSLMNQLLKPVRWIPFLLLLVTIADPTIWQPAAALVQGACGIFGDHSDRLAHELCCRLMNGSM